MTIQQPSCQEVIEEFLGMPRDQACALSAHMALTHGPVGAYYPNAAPGQASDIERITKELQPTRLSEDQSGILGPYCIEGPRFVRGLALWIEKGCQAVRNGNC